MILSPSNLETHPTGTINKNGIITGNWQIINAMLDPDLDALDPTFGTLYGILERAVNGQRGATTKTYSATVEIKMASHKRVQILTLAGNVTIDLDEKKAGREVVLIIHGDGSSRTVTWNASHKWASTAITTIPAGKIARVTITCEDDTNAGVILAGTITP